MTDLTTRAKWARHVRRQAAGLTPEQVAHKLRGVRAWERNGVAVEDTTSYSAVGARLSVAEWQRIADLLAATGAATYDPDADPGVREDPAVEQARIESLLHPLTPAELQRAEEVLATLQAMRAVPDSWTAQHVALTMQLVGTQVGTCECCGRSGQQIRETPGAWVCVDTAACAAAGGGGA